MDEQVKEITPDELLQRLNEGKKMQIIDVREQHEWDSGHIPQAIHIPLGILPLKLQELDKNTPIVMVCRSGARSWNATAFVQEHGFQAENMAGGMLAWTGDIEYGNE